MDDFWWKERRGEEEPREERERGEREEKKVSSKKEKSTTTVAASSSSLSISIGPNALVYRKAHLFVLQKKKRKDTGKKRKEKANSKHEPGNVDQNVAEPLALLFFSSALLSSPASSIYAEHPVAEPDPQVALQQRVHLPQLGPHQRVGDDRRRRPFFRSLLRGRRRRRRREPDRGEPPAGGDERPPLRRPLAPAKVAAPLAPAQVVRELDGAGRRVLGGVEEQAESRNEVFILLLPSSILLVLVLPFLLLFDRKQERLQPGQEEVDVEQVEAGQGHGREPVPPARRRDRAEEAREVGSEVPPGEAPPRRRRGEGAK